MSSPREILTTWLAATNQRDPYALAGLYHENAESHHISLGTVTRGRAALQQSFITFFRAFPDTYAHPENILESGPWGIVEWSGGGTFTGQLGNLQPTGRSFTLRGSAFLRINEGKITLQRCYYDRASWCSQLGITAK